MFFITGQIHIKCYSSLSKNIMYVLICSRNWFRFQEVMQEELTAEQDLLKQLQELSIDGDISVFPSKSFDKE